MRFRLALVAAFAAAALISPAHAKTSHKGWPKIDGVLHINKHDSHGTKHGSHKNDELLGGHGNDVLHGRGGRDVLWGDHKPCCQPESQVDVLHGGPKRDHIYGSHGTNHIDAGGGWDYVKVHWGRGTVDCGPGRDTVYVSRRNRPLYRIRNCERISHKTLGY